MSFNFELRILNYELTVEFNKLLILLKQAALPRESLRTFRTFRTLRTFRTFENQTYNIK